MDRIYILVSEASYKAHGVRVIINQIAKANENITVCHKKSDIPTGAKVIPYGLLMSKSMADDSRFSHDTAILVDAYSLGESSTLSCFWSKHYIPLTLRLRMVLKYIKFCFYERIVLKKYKKIMLVSWGDKEYYRRNILTKQFAGKIFVIQNGVEIPSPIKQKEYNSGKLVIGCLSPWATITFYMLIVFLNEIWSKMPTHDNIELQIAGRGLDKWKCDLLRKYKNVKVVGEVDKLEDFYSNIDVSLVTMYKKCGIINRVLDGFSFQIPVLCHPNSLLAFKDIPNCCYTYTDTTSFMKQISEIQQHREEVANKVNAAYNFIIENHNWDKNYTNFTLQ